MNALAYINQRLQQILSLPGMFGAHESVELQVIQLLEVRWVIAARTDRGVTEVWTRYKAFVARVFPGDPPVALIHRLAKHQRSHEFQKLLQAFVDEELALQRKLDGNMPLV